MLVSQLCLTHCDPMDCNPPGSSVHGILQATILEWVAMPFSIIIKAVGTWACSNTKTSRKGDSDERRREKTPPHSHVPPHTAFPETSVFSRGARHTPCQRARLNARISQWGSPASGTAGHRASLPGGLLVYLLTHQDCLSGHWYFLPHHQTQRNSQS